MWCQTEVLGRGRIAVDGEGVADRREPRWVVEKAVPLLSRMLREGWGPTGWRPSLLCRLGSLTKMGASPLVELSGEELRLD